MFTSGPGKKTFLVILTVVITASLLSCSSVKIQQFSHEQSDYLKLGTPEADKLIKENIISGSLLPVEKVGGELCVLKSRYYDQNRGVDDINYVGLIMYFERSLSGGISRYLGIAPDNRLKTLAGNIRESLMDRSGVDDGLVIMFDDMETIRDDQVEMLTNSDFKCLMFNNLAYITVDQAETFSTFKGKSLCLNGLLWMSQDQIDALSDFGGDYLSFNGIKTITESQVKSLCRFNGKKIYLKGLYEESKEIVSQYSGQSIASLVVDGN